MANSRLIDAVPSFCHEERADREYHEDHAREIDDNLRPVVTGIPDEKFLAVQRSMIFQK